MEQTILNLLEILACIIVTIGIFYGGSKLFEFIISKCKDGPLKDLLFKIEQIFVSAIKEIYQTEVEALKNEGKFDPVAQNKVKSQAHARIKAALDPKMIDQINKGYGDVDKYIDNHIEEVIYNLKRGKRAIVVRK